MEEMNGECPNPIEESTNNSIKGYASLDEYLKVAYPAVVAGIRASNSLPSISEFGYYATFPEFLRLMKGQGDRLHRLMNGLMLKNGVRRKSGDLETVIDSNDKCLDLVAAGLAELDGRKRNPGVRERAVAPSGGWHDPGRTVGQGGASKEEVTLCLSACTVRPQTFFKDKIDNSNAPWVPRIAEKPNALKPLAVTLQLSDSGQECFSHPYDYELSLWRPSDSLLSRVDTRPPRPLADTPLCYVDTPEGLASLLDHLRGQSELAIDLEHHSYRSFMGFTCLLQISSWETDYIVDALKLRDQLHILNQVFTDPKILKVLHGAESDVEWLQRDLSLYLVGMFDTYQAAKVLALPRLSLAHLLHKYCRVEANKKFQLYDWRKRPLPEKALRYAREDTHYLLHIYREMRNELVDKASGKTNLLEAVYLRSRDTCARVYVKPCLEEDSHMTLYRRLKLCLDNRQLWALRELYRWRDKTARQEDESTGYVLPNHMMVQMCRTLPREVGGLLACCNPIPPLVRASLQELHRIVLAAKEQPLLKSLPQEGAKNGEEGPGPGGLADPRLVMPQDNTGLEHRDDLPTLLGGGLPPSTTLTRPAPAISLWEHDSPPPSPQKGVLRLHFVSPYQRYLRVLPYSIQLDREEQERAEQASVVHQVGHLDVSSSKEADEDPPPSQQEPLAIDRSYVKRARKEEEGNVAIKSEPEERTGDFGVGVGVSGGEVSCQPSSTGRQPSSTGRQPSSTGLQPPSTGLQPSSTGRHNKKNKKLKEWKGEEKGWSKAVESFDYSGVDFGRFLSGAAPTGKGRKGKLGQEGRKNRGGNGKRGRGGGSKRGRGGGCPW